MEESEYLAIAGRVHGQLLALAASGHWRSTDDPIIVSSPTTVVPPTSVEAAAPVKTPVDTVVPATAVPALAAAPVVLSPFDKAHPVRAARPAPTT